MNTNKVRTISIKSIIGCIIFLGFGISFILTNRLFTAGKENWIILNNAKIHEKVELSPKNHYVIVEYTVPQEETRYKQGDVYSSAYYVGQTINIKYNPNNHDEITMVVDNKTINIPFTIAGSIIVAISVAMLATEISRGINAKKQILENNSQLNLDYAPSFTFEYVPLKAENQGSYYFKQQTNDLNNYEVTDSKGKVIFYTKRIKKGIASNATYQLIDSATKQTTIVNLKKSIFNRENVESRIKVNGLSLDKYFETRHVTYNISKEGNTTKYTLFNNGSTLGFIYERNNQVTNFDIDTAKENIDDLSLFALCITYKQK